MKKKLWILVGVALVLTGVYQLTHRDSGASSSGYKSAEYVISGQKIKLDGRPFKYFGNEVQTDLDKDGREDLVFLITEQKASGEVWYYAVGALNTPDGYVGSEGVLIGSNISPQSTHMNKQVGKEDQIVVNYAQGSVGKSIWLKYDPVRMQFGEVVQNFEGESK
jgi:hypothetical protein